MRVLLVAPPLVGHVVPLIGIARDLRARDHRVSWAVDPGVLRLVAPEEHVDHPVTGPVTQACGTDRPDGLRAFAALAHLWESVLLPLADEMIDGVRSAVALERPDVLVVDQQALAGALVAEEYGVPWVSSASTSGELVTGALSLPTTAEWIRARQQELRARHGIRGLADLRFSPSRTVVHTAPELAGRLRVPAGSGPVSAVGPPWPDPVPQLPVIEAVLGTGPVVVVSMGTANRSVVRPFLDRMREAVRGLDDVSAVVVDPLGAAPDGSPSVRGREVTVATLPRLALLDRAAAVVCHGGHNSVVEALAHGIPLVVAPIRDDQPLVAAQVVAAGAGIRVRFDRSGPETLRSALSRAVEEPALAAGAAAVSEGLARAARRAPGWAQVAAVARAGTPAQAPPTSRASR